MAAFTTQRLATLVAGNANTGRLAALQKPYVPSAEVGIEDITYTTQNAVIAAASLIYSDEYENYDVGEAPGGEDADEAKAKYAFKVLILTNLENGAAANFFLDLVGCHQVKPLSAENIINYSQSLRLLSAPSNAVAIIDYWSRTTPSLVDTEGFMARAETIEFVRYHTNSSSSGALCNLALSAQPYDGYFTPLEVAAIGAAVASQHDITLARQLTTMTLVKTQAWLEVIERLPATWYMGKKAVHLFPALHYNILVNNLKFMTKKIKAESQAVEEDDRPGIVNKITDILSQALQQIEGGAAA